MRTAANEVEHEYKEEKYPGKIEPVNLFIVAIIEIIIEI